LQAGYDVIVISSPNCASVIIHDGFCKSEHDFLMTFYKNLLSMMHGFRDNEVLLQAGYDVTVFSLGDASGEFS